MNIYVEKFIDKLANQTPEMIEVKFGNHKVSFDRVYIIQDPIPEIESLLTKAQYKISYSVEYVADLEGQQLHLQIQHRYNPDSTYDRLEVHVPRRKFQLTCLHFGGIGMTGGQSIVELSQRVTFANRDGKNDKRMEQACKHLEKEGLLLMNRNKSPRWCIGEYNARTNGWLHGKTTQKFFEDFIKVALIMGLLRGHDQELEIISEFLSL
jgi:hypothetical protein